MKEVEKNAYLLIASVNAALHNGVRHYLKGKSVLLRTPQSIIQAMSQGGVDVDERDRVERTTTAHEYFLLTGEQLDTHERGH